jgi:hypothetical protein
MNAWTLMDRSRLGTLWVITGEPKSERYRIHFKEIPALSGQDPDHSFHKSFVVVLFFDIGPLILYKK